MGTFEPLKQEGVSRVIFACLAHMKVPFIAEKSLFTERKYRVVSKSYRGLKVSRRPASSLKYIEKLWSKFGLFGPHFFLEIK